MQVSLSPQNRLRDWAFHVARNNKPIQESFLFFSIVSQNEIYSYTKAVSSCLLYKYVRSKPYISHTWLCIELS